MVPRGGKMILPAENRKDLTRANFDGYDYKNFEKYVRRDQADFIEKHGDTIDPTGLRRQGYEFDHIVPAKEAYLRGWSIGQINAPSNFQMMAKSDNASKGAGRYRGVQSLTDFWRPRTIAEGPIPADPTDPARPAVGRISPANLANAARNLRKVPTTEKNWRDSPFKSGGIPREPNAMDVDQRAGGGKRKTPDTLRYQSSIGSTKKPRDE